MRSRFLVVAAAALLLASVSARADEIFTLSGVTLAGGGTLTGTFTTNNALTSVISYDITASPAGAFTGFEYTTGDSSVTAETLPSQYFQIDSTGSIDELRLYFTAGGLTASGGQISSTFSYEHEPSGGNREPSGSVVAGSSSSVTPEPSSIALLGTGLLGVAGVVKRRFA